MTFTAAEVRRITPLLRAGDFRVITKLVLKKDNDAEFSIGDLTVILFWEWLIHLGYFTDANRRYMVEVLKPTLEKVSKDLQSEHYPSHRELSRFPICVIDGRYLTVPEHRACYDILEETELPAETDHLQAAVALTIIQCNIKNLLRSRWTKLRKLRETNEPEEERQNIDSGDVAK